MTDKEMIVELLGLVDSQYQTKKRKISQEIHKLLNSDFEVTENTYTESLLKLKEITDGFVYQCSYMHTARILAVDVVLNIYRGEM